MSYKLSKREKKLLYILLILVIVLGGWFLLLEPSFKEYNEKSADLGEKEITLSGLKNTYLDYVDAPAKALDESAKFLTNKEKFYTTMINEDVDKMMTRMALLYGLQPLSLTIGEVTPANIVSYETSLAESSTTESSSNSESDEEVIVNKIEVSMSLAGDITNAFALADSIKDSTSIRLKDYSYIKGETVVESSMVLVFDIYMVNE